MEEFMQPVEKSGKSKSGTSKHKKKESRQDKTSNKPEWEEGNVTPRHEKGLDPTVFTNSPIKSSSKKKKRERKRATAESDENCPPQEEKDASDTPEIPDPLKGKHKRKKNKMPPGVQPLEGSPPRTEIEPIHRSLPETISSKVKTPNDLKCKARSRSDNETSQQGIQHELAFHRSNVVTYTSTPMSSPTALPKTKRHKKPKGPGRTEDTNGMSDQSQDLFITQKKFVSSHWSSEDSPPLGQEQRNGVPDWLRNQQPHHGAQLLSQLSCLRHNSVDPSSAESNQQVALKENATQTEDSFTYLALMSLMKKAKVLEPCPEEALDLSLPSRNRAKKAALSPGGDVIIIKSQSSSADSKASRKNNIKFCFSPLQKADETKFVQTVLNSSYFFKGKGEPGEANPPIPPILKMKEKSKKKLRRSKVHVRKDTKAT